MQIESLTKNELTFHAKISKMGKRKMIMIPTDWGQIIENNRFEKQLLEITLKKLDPDNEEI